MKNLLFLLPVLLVSAGFHLQRTHPAVTPEQAPVEGKIYFSNQPFKGTAANSTKTEFTSAENIYARLEIPAGTIKEVFKVKEDEKTKPVLKCHINISKGGEWMPYGSSRDYILLMDEFKNSNYLNFDILPEPSKATTLYGMLEDFSAGYGRNPISSLMRNGRWPDGDLTVKVRIYTETYNAYGSLQDEEKWPSLEGEFGFKFREDDAAKIMANEEKIQETSVENAFRYETLPSVFANPGKLTDPNATSAKIAAILKRDLPKRQILKWVAETYNGPYWHIATNDYGIPRYKYFNPHIWMAYKLNGKCYVGYATLRQIYAGSGTYGPLQVAFTSASNISDYGIDCTKIK